jgi:hypothetical protein
MTYEELMAKKTALLARKMELLTELCAAHSTALLEAAHANPDWDPLALVYIKSDYRDTMTWDEFKAAALDDIKSDYKDTMSWDEFKAAALDEPPVSR